MKIFDGLGNESGIKLPEGFDLIWGTVGLEHEDWICFLNLGGEPFMAQYDKGRNKIEMFGMDYPFDDSLRIMFVVRKAKRVIFQPYEGDDDIINLVGIMRNDMDTMARAYCQENGLDETKAPYVIFQTTHTGTVIHIKPIGLSDTLPPTHKTIIDKEIQDGRFIWKFDE